MRFIYDNFSKKPYKPFYNAVVPRAYRKQWHYNYSEIPTQMHVAEFWQDAITKYQKGEIAHYNLTIHKPELVGKKIIWQFWAQGFDNLPEIAQLCFDSVDRFKQDYQVIRLTDMNYKEYVNFPDFVEEKRKLPEFKTAFFSDLLRTALLKIYGGVWLDASVVLTKNLESYLTQLDYFVYSRDPNSPYQDLAKDNGHCYFNWQKEFKVNFLNSIIFAKANHSINIAMTDLLLYFWKTQLEVEHYFFYQILMNQLKKSRSEFFNFPIIDDVLPHLMQEVIKQRVDETKFTEILQVIGIHKLNLHHPLAKTKGQNLTYYGRLYQFIYEN